MTALLLIRHAHTDTAGKRLTGRTRGVHLNPRGRAEAEALARRLRGVSIAAIYSSPLERCRETAAPLARAGGLAIRSRRGLLEVDYGEWTGRPISQLRRTKLWRVVQQAPSAMRFPGGESLLEVQDRAVAEVMRIAAEHAGRAVAVVTHADVVRLLLAHFAGMHLDHFQRLVVDPASVTVIQTHGGVPRIVRVNDTGDLDALRRRRRTPPRVRG